MSVAFELTCVPFPTPLDIWWCTWTFSWLMYSWSLYKQTHILLALIEKKICKLNIFRIYYRNRLSLKSTDRPVPMQDASWINSVKCTYWFMQLLANAITNFIKYNLHQLCKAQDFFSGLVIWHLFSQLIDSSFDLIRCPSKVPIPSDQ